MSECSIAYSAELMSNYLQGATLAPDAKFQALQTDSGASLLFSLGTDEALYLTRETPTTRTGWERTDLSSAQIASDFAHEQKARCTDFSVAQSYQGTAPAIHLAMVVNDGYQDHLYLSLNNPGTDAAWTTPPSWIAYPFDNPSHPLDRLQVVGFFISEASDGEYIVVDVARDPSRQEALVSRYYISNRETGSYAWREHDLGIDLDGRRYSSCLGRSAGEPFDGLYTAGQISGSPQLIYQPLYDQFDDRLPAPPARLHLPEQAIPDAIAACRNADDTTDLYVEANGAIYCFVSDNQKDKAVGVALVRHACLDRCRALFATASGDSVTVWGLSGDDEVFSLTCERSRLTDPSAWSIPLPLLSSVQQLAPYLDRANRANTFFAHVEQDQLVKAVKSPDTSLWSLRNIHLAPASATIAARRFSSYTTRIQIADTEGRPAAGIPVTITATNLTSAFINHSYYVMGATPIHVTADPFGAVTVVEPVDTISGTRLSVAAGGAQVVIDPAEKAFRKATALTSAEALSKAQITSADGSTRPLVPPGTSRADLQAAAGQLVNLSAVRARFSPAPSVAAAPRVAGAEAAAVAPTASGLNRPTPPGDALESLLVDAGDLFRYLYHKVDAGMDHLAGLIEDVGTGVWRFVVTIAGETYHCILDCVEKVVSAVQWLYTAIKTAVHDLIEYLQFLFDWADIRRCKEVMANMIKVFLNHELDQVDELRRNIDKGIDDAIGSLASWAETARQHDFGTHGAKSAGNLAAFAGKAMSEFTAPASFLEHHLLGNIQGFALLPYRTIGTSSVEKLAGVLESETEVVGATLTGLWTLLTRLPELTPEDALKEFAGLVGAETLRSAKSVMGVLLEVLVDIVAVGIDILEKPIHIPVVSDIIKDVFHEELKFSILDIVCWVGAVPATLACKIAFGSAPFPAGARTESLIAARDYQALLSAFSGSPLPAVSRGAIPKPLTTGLLGTIGMLPAAGGAGNGGTQKQAKQEPGFRALGGLVTIPHDIARELFKLHACAGAFAIPSALFTAFEASCEEDSEERRLFRIPATGLEIMTGIFASVPHMLIPHYPIEDKGWAWVEKGFAGARLLAKFAFSGLFKFDVGPDGMRFTGAVYDFFFIFCQGLCTMAHVRELASKPNNGTRTIAYLEVGSEAASYVSRWSYAMAVKPGTDPKTKAFAIGTMALGKLGFSGFQLAVASKGA